MSTILFNNPFVMPSFNFKAIVAFIVFLSFSATLFGQGKIAGKVVDKNSGEVVIGANITVKDANTGAASDLDGNYFISVAPGIYIVVVEYLGYQPTETKDVIVVNGETTHIDFAISEGAEELKEVVVTAESPVRETSNAILVQQKNAVAMVTGISAEQFKKMPDRNTSDVLKRVSGASIQEGKFAVIRGLNDRYNMAMLNGSPMPSTESDRKAFSFDIIPSNLLDNVMITKTATPDMPADFAGGSIQINTRDIPEENLRFINVGGSIHSLTTFKNYYQSPAKSNTDFLGYDNGKRSIPNGTFTTEQAQNNKDLNILADQSKKFNNQFTPNLKNSASPNWGLQAGISQRLKLFNNPLGIIFAVTYGKGYRYSPFTNNSASIDKNQTFDKNVQDGNYYSIDNYRTSVNVGGIFNISYRLGLNNKISFKNLYTINSEDQVIFRNGEAYQEGRQIRLKMNDYAVWYQSSKMLSSQLNYERNTDKLKIKFTVGKTNINRDIPDYKRLLYASDKSFDATEFTQTSVIIQPSSGAYSPYTSGRFSSKLNESMWTYNGSIAVPFQIIGKNEIKFGGFYQNRIRNFSARNYTYTYNENKFSSYEIFKQGPDSIFRPENFAADKLFQSEKTSPQDKYYASSNLTAGFVMLDNRFTNKLRLIWGARYEIFNQKLNSSFLNKDINLNKTWNDLLPSANFIFSLTEKSNLRASFSKTLSRPEFREFAPFSFLDFNTNAIIAGAPNLDRAKIYNYDLRYEIFPGAGNTFSVTPFYKRFISPVEMAVQPNASNRTFTYLNAKSAQSYGIELELRFTLIKPAELLNINMLKNISFFGNYAAISSKVDLTGTDAESIGSRPLQGQSPFVFNGGIQYSNQERKFDITVAGNRVGRRIAYVANESALLIWENGRTILDFSISKIFFKKLTARFVIGDILAKTQPLIFYQDLNNNKKYDKGQDIDTFNYKFGMNTSFSLGYQF